jgi:hypothetical protein
LYYFYKRYPVELFSNARSSLSVYYPNSIDGTPFSLEDYLWDQTADVIPNKIYLWNGTWRDPGRTNYKFQLLQNNDKLIISILNTDTTTITTLDNNFPSNTFSGYAQLDTNRYRFTMKEILFNNLNGLDTSNIAESVYGSFNGESLYETSTNIKNILQNGITEETSSSLEQQIQNEIQSLTIDVTMNMGMNNNLVFSLQRVGNMVIQDYPGQAYLNRDMYVNPIPILEVQEESSIRTVCPTTMPKYCTSIQIEKDGVTDGHLYTGCVTDSSDCTRPFTNPNDACLFYDRPVTLNGDTYSVCPESSRIINLNTNYLNVKALSSIQQSDLNVCNHLQMFKFRSYILFYISNLSQVQTLGYSFFGSNPGESSLIIEPTVFSSILYKHYIIPILQKWTTSRNPILTQKLISMYGKDLNYAMRKKLKNKKPPTQNNMLNTVFWKIQKSYTTNACTVNIQTVPELDHQVQKYIDTTRNGMPFLSMFEGGTNQNLFLENLTLLEDTPQIKLFSTDIRTSTGLYFQPEETQGDFYNSTRVVGKKSLSTSGRWLILGTPLSSISNVLDAKKELERNITSIMSQSETGTSIGYHVPVISEESEVLFPTASSSDDENALPSADM